ncbi:MAG: carboxymuconolactone decarboxylase family protein [Mangrovicoccus sp.]
MPDFTFYDLDTAPEASKPLLQNSLKSFGMVPGLHQAFAISPETLEAYQTLHTLFQKTSFNAEELTVVWQSINVEHGCHYCVPAHAGIAAMMKIDPAITDALRKNTPLADPKLEALRKFTLIMLRNRGMVEDTDIEAFYAAGYGQKQVIEIILGLAQKVMSNYTNHIAKTPVDPAFEKFVEPEMA